ncbi:ClpXP protease specificity-enhancing factor [Candidatus Methylomicrobium oryzae]|jgi:stringent starvation protein B|uniref:ClpXP protease specificity-enhancing factor n=1 Tax=Candidatus Methylomicrobium oryzae TaxID=2802053 RepID=UPI0019230D3A|nr:ClpXP protease specificity-enhancing factor [Methylomicrobium sp. RS1]MBL1262753.1 ClpXP protease specificity-enhancing factor [Methylomicrobium sp. RS1]
MTPLKPYLIRSIYEWITDNGLTPYLLVNAEHPGALVPNEFVEGGRIVLNVRPEAVQGLSLGNDQIEFNARFGGIAKHIFVPVRAVLAIYAKENGKGMIFDPEEEIEDDTPPETPDTRPPTGRPRLKVVK